MSAFEESIIQRIKRLEREIERLQRWERPTDGSGVTDHGGLTGLADDDHTQYLNNARHDTTARHTLGTVVPHDSTKADDIAVVHKSGDESVGGIKTFTSFPVTPSIAPTSDYQAANKKYVDDNAGGVTDHGDLTGLLDDDHTQYLNNTRHDTTGRHTLGTVVPHDDHGSLSGLTDDDHTQYTKHPASSTDNAIARWDGTGGRTLQGSSVIVDDNGKLSGDGLDGWIYDTDTWTYVSATSFKITGKDVRYRFPKGTKIKLVQSSTTKYFYVVATSYTSGNTIVTVTGGSDYSLVSGTISGQAYSYAAAPQNFPQWFNYTPIIYTGWSALPTGTYKFYAVGNTCFYNIDQSDGTSNDATTRLGIPITAAGNQVFSGACGLAVDNGAILTGAARWYIDKSSTWVQFQKDMGTTSFTTSGTKRVRALVIYEF